MSGTGSVADRLLVASATVYGVKSCNADIAVSDSVRKIPFKVTNDYATTCNSANNVGSMEPPVPSSRC